MLFILQVSILSEQRSNLSISFKTKLFSADMPSIPTPDGNDRSAYTHCLRVTYNHLKICPRPNLPIFGISQSLLLGRNRT